MSEALEDTVSITLGERICLDSIEDLQHQLEEVNPGAIKKIVVDAEDVDDIDFIGLQLLAVFHRKMKAANVKVDWENLPIVMFQAANDLDFCDELGL